MGLRLHFEQVLSNLFGSEADRESLLVLHSASKGLLDEIKHARRGLETHEVAHVTGELDVIISILESESWITKRLHNANELKTTFMNAHQAISSPESSRALMRELDELSERTLEMHRALEERLPRTSNGHESFRPPNHRTP